MHQTATVTSAGGTPSLHTLEAARLASDGAPGSPLSTLLGWVEGYLMSAHAELGRSGARNGRKSGFHRPGASEPAYIRPIIRLRASE